MEYKEQEIARQIFTELEEHNAGYDGLVVNSTWVKRLKEKWGVPDIETRELGVNVPRIEK